MHHIQIQDNEFRTLIRVAEYGGANGTDERHVMITLPDYDPSDAAGQIDRIARSAALLAGMWPGSVAVLARAFVSDGANQGDLVRRQLSAVLPEASLSLVEQPPLNGTKLALWVYLRSSVTISRTGAGSDTVAVSSPGSPLTHLYTCSRGIPEFGSEVAAMTLLQDYDTELSDIGISFADNCVRTWFYVRDVDTNYPGMVRGRNEIFRHMGLSRDTHFIASTGIGGRHVDPRVTVQMDTYTISGLRPGQQTYLHAPEYLNPTYEYGVAFERGVLIDYADRRHVLISGTASINNRGEVEHPGNVILQTRRMLDNVSALLREAGATLNDCGHFIIYLRDIADAAVVSRLFDELVPNMPRVIVHAPVCRPGWLIEMECMAVVSHESAYAPY